MSQFGCPEAAFREKPCKGEVALHSDARHGFRPGFPGLSPGRGSFKLCGGKEDDSSYSSTVELSKVNMTIDYAGFNPNQTRVSVWSNILAANDC